MRWVALLGCGRLVGLYCKMSGEYGCSNSKGIEPREAYLS